jgi:nucleotide-binding universal stress UspA family protein
MSTPHKKIIWALDPFEDDALFRTQITQVLKNLTTRLRIPVEPTYILNLTKENELEAIRLPPRRHYQGAALQAIQTKIKDFHEIPFTTPKILYQPTSSFIQLVGKLCEYARHSRTEAIVVGTHARSGLSRLLLGSFTESLLIQSEVPVITVNPSCQPIVDSPLDWSIITPFNDRRKAHSDSTILFATDLAQSSEQIYPYLMNFAEKIDSAIHLFHVSPHRFEPLLQTGSYLMGGGWVGAPERVTAEDSAASELLQQWASRGTERGLTVQFDLESQRAPIADLIIQKASEIKCQWIAMTAQSSGFRAWALGSITRRVVRTAPCPVWILRPAH